MLAGLHLIVEIQREANDDSEDLGGLTRWLHAELLEVDVELIEPLVFGEAVSGAKGLGGVVNALAVQLSSATLPTILRRICGWVTRNDHSVKVTIDGDVLEIDKATPKQQEAIINVWLARYASNA